MNTIYLVYDTTDALVGIFKDQHRAEVMMHQKLGWYITEIQTDLFGTKDGAW